MTDWALLFPVSRMCRELLQIIEGKTNSPTEKKKDGQELSERLSEGKPDDRIPHGMSVCLTSLATSDMQIYMSRHHIGIGWARARQFAGVKCCWGLGELGTCICSGIWTVAEPFRRAVGRDEVCGHPWAHSPPPGPIPCRVSGTCTEDRHQDSQPCEWHRRLETSWVALLKEINGERCVCAQHGPQALVTFTTHAQNNWRPWQPGSFVG